MTAIRMPDAGYMPSTAVEPEEPVKAGEWYEYHIFLQPTMYTVQEGHHLRLSANLSVRFADEGIHASFLVDNSASYVRIPTGE